MNKDSRFGSTAGIVASSAEDVNVFDENYVFDDCDSTALSAGLGIGLNNADLSLVAHRNAHTHTSDEHGYELF